MKFRPVGAQLFHADGQTRRTDGQTDSRLDEANSPFFAILQQLLKSKPA